MAAASRLWSPAAKLRTMLSRRSGTQQQMWWARDMGYAAQAAVEVEGWKHGSRAAEEVHSQEQDRGVQWVFLGCPGVGKGTYASRLAKLMQVPHIAMGDLVRQELLQKTPMAQQTASAKLIGDPNYFLHLSCNFNRPIRKLQKIMGSGQLLPDEIIFRLLSKRLETGVSEGETGFILDGFPRTVHQAEIMEEVAEIDLVVNLKLREDVLVTKCLGRRICGQCGGNFNVANIDFEGSGNAPRIFMPPLLPPPSCATKMTIRADDTEEVVKARLRVYYEESKLVEDFYRCRGLLMDFDVAGGIPETWPRLLSALNLEEKQSTSHDSRKMAA